MPASAFATTLAVSQRVGIAINERIATPLLIGIVRPLIFAATCRPDWLVARRARNGAVARTGPRAPLGQFGEFLGSGSSSRCCFFHPAVWWVSRWVRRDREECCDAVVVAQTEKPQAYGRVCSSRSQRPPSLSSPPLAGMGDGPTPARRPHPPDTSFGGRKNVDHPQHPRPRRFFRSGRSGSRPLATGHSNHRPRTNKHPRSPRLWRRINAWVGERRV